MRKFLVNVITSQNTDIIKAGQQFEAVEDNSFPYSNKYIVITGVINGLYLSGYLFGNGNVIFPVVNATLEVKELETRNE